jgi:hypothetical protein
MSRRIVHKMCGSKIVRDFFFKFGMNFGSFVYWRKPEMRKKNGTAI